MGNNTIPPAYPLSTDPSTRHWGSSFLTALGRTHPVALAMCVAAVTVALFLPALNFGFVNLDDAQYVHHNPRVTAGITPQGLKAAFQVFNREYWVPVLFLSLMADAQLFGTHAWGYHLVNILFHAANAALLFLLLRGATRRTWPAFLASLLFALHPLRIESVVWVSQRKDVLSTFFVLLALTSWSHYTAATARMPRRCWYGLTFLLLVLGLMTKPMLVTFPALLLILDIWPMNRCRIPWPDPAGWWRNNHRLILEKIPFLALGLAFSALTIFNQRAQVATGAGVENLADPLLRAPLAYFIYFGKMVWPVGLGLEFRHSNLTIPVARGFAAVVAHAALLYALWRLRDRRPYLLAGWLWYLLALLPVSGIVPVGLQWISDRFTYVPAMGLAVALVWLAADPLPERSEGAAAVASLVVLAALAWGTASQIRIWKDSETLFRHSVHLDPDNPRAYFVFGSALARVGKLDEALDVMEQGVRRAPHDPVILEGFAHVLADLGQVDESIHILKEEAAQRPENIRLHSALAQLQGMVADWEGRKISLTVLLGLVRSRVEKSLISNELAKTLWILGRKDEAIVRFRESVDQQPSSPAQRFDLGLALLRQGRPNEAIAEFETLARLNNRHPLAEIGLAESLAASGRKSEAIGLLEAFTKKESKGPEANFAQGRLAELVGKTEEAKDLYRRALEAAPSPDLLRLMRFGMEQEQVVKGPND